MNELLHAPEVDECEAVITVSDRNGRELIKAAVDKAKVVGELAEELAEISRMPPGSYALYSGDGAERLDPTRTLDDNLSGQREAEVRLLPELTGN